MAQLILRPSINGGESLRAFLLRAATANGLPGIQAILQRASLTSSYMLVRTELRQLSEVLAISEIKLERSSYWPFIGRQRRFGNTTISRLQLNMSRPRVCSHCLKQENIVPRIWDLKAYVACHKHETLLIDTCPGCSAEISWTRAEIDRCGCGTKFATATPLRANHHLVRLSRLLIRNMIHGPRHEGDFPVIGLDSTASLTWFFSTMERETNEWKPLYRAVLNVQSTADILTACPTVMLEWPTGFREWLARRLSEQKHDVPQYREWNERRFSKRLAAVFNDPNVYMDSEVRSLFGSGFGKAASTKEVKTLPKGASGIVGIVLEGRKRERRCFADQKRQRPQRLMAPRESGKNRERADTRQVENEPSENLIVPSSKL